MVEQQFWDAIRAINVVLAALAVVVLLVRHIWRDWRYIPAYKRMSAMSNEAYGVCYVIAASIAHFQDVDAGIYTGVMSIPIFWHLLAGLTDDPDKDQKPRGKTP